jgi:DNA recombination protein RmuC
MSDSSISLIIGVIIGTAFLMTAVILLATRYLIRGSDDSLSGLAGEVRDELRKSREDSSRSGRELREEITGQFAKMNNSALETLRILSDTQAKQLERVNQTLLESTQAVRDELERIRRNNDERLEEMRQTVDEKLQKTLDHRLSESFKNVSERLEAVHKGLGEMQSLAADVGGLKNVLTNVKVRGTWAEVQLGAILEQILTRSQYETNVRVKPDCSERVEFAIRLPGPADSSGKCVWLPIDSKFPQEDYLRLQEAAAAADVEAEKDARQRLGRAIIAAAKDISGKYIDPPNTTDFAIMFLATEGLYAEVLRDAELSDKIQREYRVVIAGPTTLAAILSSLRMGFQTLAIERRAAEVWQVLAAVKTEFRKFGDRLEAVKKHLQTASNAIDSTGARTRAIERKLKDIEEIPSSNAVEILGLGPDGTDDEYTNSSGEADHFAAGGD